MVYLIGLVIVGFVIYGIVKFAGGKHYSEMSEEEFEQEAKRTSVLGAAIGPLQKVFDPSHHVEYIEEQQQRVEAEDADSGDRPETGPDSKNSNNRNTK